MEVDDILQLIFICYGRNETLRMVTKSWKAMYEDTPWEFPHFYTSVSNLGLFRTIYPRSKTIIHYISKNKSDLVLLNTEPSVFLTSIDNIKFKKDNCVETLHVKDENVTDAFFPLMPQLKSLDLTTRKVTDDIFYDMPKLRELTLSYMENATEIETFPSQLKKLSIIGGEQMSEDVSLPVGLRCLTLRFTAFDDGHLYLPLLTFLDIRSSAAMINDAAFNQMPKLEELYLDNPPWLTDRALSSLRHLKVLSTKSGRVACSAVGNLKSLMVCNAEFANTFPPHSRIKAESIETVSFHNLEVHAELFNGVKISTLLTESCVVHPKCPGVEIMLK